VEAGKMKEGANKNDNFRLTTKTIGDRIARPVTIHLAHDVWNGGYVAETQPDRVTIKRHVFCF